MRWSHQRRIKRFLRRAETRDGCRRVDRARQLVSKRIGILCPPGRVLSLWALEQRARSSGWRSLRSTHRRGGRTYGGTPPPKYVRMSVALPLPRCGGCIDLLHALVKCTCCTHVVLNIVNMIYMYTNFFILYQI